MSDKLVFDLAQEVEGSPNVFVRKDWLNILDNQNQNYNNNQSVIDTSQLSNSNKYMSYREAYFSIPFLITLGSTSYDKGTLAPTVTDYFKPDADTSSADCALGLKNWFGQIIHSFTLDYNGTTIVQQTPYINMWNSFKLMTSLSLDDINTQGATIGFYPDDADSVQFIKWDCVSPVGEGTCNNSNYNSVTPVASAYFNYRSGGGNIGYLTRQGLINFDTEGVISGANSTGSVSTFGDLLYTDATKTVWKSYISKKAAQTGTTALSDQGLIQFTVVATVYLKHVHSFFNMCPLLKGVFMKMTMNLNNVTTTFQAISSAAVGEILVPSDMKVTAVASPLGGVNPLMITSGNSTRPTLTATGGSLSLKNGACDLFAFSSYALATTAGSVTIGYKMNISVGATCLDSDLNAISNAKGGGGTESKSIYLYIPAYTFNPVFEQAYLSSPVKQIKYTDVYQYQVINVNSSAQFNNLLTNGIANVKSVLILPFYSSTGGEGTDSVTGNSKNTGLKAGIPVFQSPFDPAGTGPTSPCSWITNFNVQVSGQNAIYNLEKYNFEQFNNQLYGQNAVNGGLTDGITSGLIDRTRFDLEYCYYYVNIERMLPVEMSVPKSIQVLGTNLSSKALDLYCFIEYGVEISIDALTGARV